MTEVYNFIVQSFATVLPQLHGAQNIKMSIDKSHNILLSNNLYDIQYFIDESHKKVYLEYTIGKESTRIIDPEIIQNSIDYYIKDNCRKNTGYIFEILNNKTSSEKNDKNNIIVSRATYKYIRTNCFTVWKSINGNYNFIEDTIMLKNDHDPRCNVNMLEDDWLNRENEFIRKVSEINHKYNLNGSRENALKAFDEYKKLYKDTYNRDLYVIAEDYQFITLKVDIIRKG